MRKYSILLGYLTLAAGSAYAQLAGMSHGTTTLPSAPPSRLFFPGTGPAGSSGGTLGTSTAATTGVTGTSVTGVGVTGTGITGTSVTGTGLSTATGLTTGTTAGTSTAAGATAATAANQVDTGAGPSTGGGGTGFNNGVSFPSGIKLRTGIAASRTATGRPLNTATAANLGGTSGTSAATQTATGTTTGNAASTTGTGTTVTTTGTGTATTTATATTGGTTLTQPSLAGASPVFTSANGEQFLLDRTFTQQLRDALVSEGSTQVFSPQTHSIITVTPLNGVVTIEGTVLNTAQAQSLENQVSRLPGVTGINDLLQVSPVAQVPATPQGFPVGVSTSLTGGTP